MELFSADDFNEKEETKEVSAETTETEEQPKEEALPESEAKAETEEPAKEAGESDKGDSGAESPKEEPEYSPNYSYKVKDKEHTFPDWMKGVVTDKEKEDYLVDLHTKAMGIEAIKESRNRVETDYNDYQQSVQNDIFPILDRVGEFDRANQVKDFSKAWEIASVNPEDVIDYLVMDEKLSQTLAQKMHDRLVLEEQGPQAVAAQRTAWNEQSRSKELELKNQSMEQKLAQLEENTFNQAVDFSLSQKQDSVQRFDQINGQGAFRNFLNDYRALSKQKGENLGPADLINNAISMLGLGNTVTPTQGTEETQNQQVKEQTKSAKEPAAIPNVGTGANVSMVQKTANTWDEWEKGLGGF